MSDNSPMMRRIRTGKSFSIPKKGRIRAVLIIILLIATTKLVSALLRSPSDTNKNKSETVRPVTQKSGKQSVAELQKTDKVQSPKINEISFDDISRILKQNPPNLEKRTDTIKDGRKSLVLHYSTDSSLQQLGKTLMNRYKPLYGAIAAIHPMSGRILTLFSYKSDSVPDLGNLYCKSIFPAASVFKTITAAAAIERAHFDAKTLVPHIGKKSTLYKYQLEKDLKDYTEMPLEEAYAFSVNSVFARLGMYTLGKSVLSEYEKRFGFNTNIPFELQTEVSGTYAADSLFQIAELASGFNQKTTISPILGALIAGAISEKGKMPKPILVDSITSQDTCIYKAKKETWSVPIREKTASELRAMMACVSRYGTAKKSFKYLRQSERFNDIEYGGKTGSLNKDSIGRVDWFVGFARNPSDPDQQIAVAVLTVHGGYWTVHSSFIAAEFFRIYLRELQLKKESAEKIKNLVRTDSTSNKETQKAQL
ncbi:MAG: hypothetical protein GX640_13160 [Fibrobacter sp.]|nr:hypothetical protein [Fibrobacter sp.]